MCTNRKIIKYALQVAKQEQDCETETNIHSNGWIILQKKNIYAMYAITGGQLLTGMHARSLACTLHMQQEMELISCDFLWFFLFLVGICVLYSKSTETANNIMTVLFLTHS